MNRHSNRKVYVAMIFRTLEEKFLADYARLEEENEMLKDELEEVESKLQDKKKNTIIDIMVMKKGKQAAFDSFCNYWTPKTYKGDRDFDEWAIELLDKLPKSVSYEEARNYFEDELEAKWEEQYDEEVSEE